MPTLHPPATTPAPAPAPAPSQPTPPPCPLLSVHQLTFIGKWSGDAAAGVAKRTKNAGFGLIELNVSNPSDVLCCVPATRDALGEAGLVACGSLGLTVDADIGSPDPAPRARGLAVLRRAVDAVAALAEGGGPAYPYLCGVNYSKLDKYGGPLTPEQRGHAHDSLRVATTYAADKGVVRG
jgi:sugar phosphate isomerase/epimerase